jgi:hypothetical protein
MNETMNNKEIAVAVIVLATITGAYYYWRRRESKKEEQPKPRKEPENERELLEQVFEDLLKNGDWKNERDFQGRMTKEYINRAKCLEWMSYLPVDLEGIMERLTDYEMLEVFEKELEKKYKKES